MENSSHHIVPYRVYLIILAILILMTGISVAVTQIDLGVITIAVALLLATVKSAFVLIYFMHLKFDNRMFSIMAVGVFLMIGVVIFVTFLDYLFR